MEVVFTCRNRVKPTGRADDYQNMCLAVAWDGQEVFISVFEGVITTWQALSKPRLPSSTAFMSEGQWELHFPSRITKQWVFSLKAWVPLNVIA